MPNDTPILFTPENVRAIHPKMNQWNERRRLHLDEDHIRLMFESGSTASEIAAVLRCSTHPVKKALRRLGLSRPAKRRSGVGAGCGNSAWKGGRRIRPDGYVMVWTRDGEQLEHRVIMEMHLGRALKGGEIVHHRDGNKSNNLISNLEVMAQSDHAKHHAPEMHAARYRK